VFVCPETSYVEVGDTFGVSIEVDSNAVELKGFDIVLSFDPEVLDVVSVAQGSLMKEGGTTFWHYREDSSSVEMISAVLGTGLSVDGPGILAVITFAASDIDRSDLVMAEVDLRDVDNRAIPFQLRHGVVYVAGLDISEDQTSPRNLHPACLQLDIFPNPCAYPLHFRYQIPHEGLVSLSIHDCAGRVLEYLVNEPQCAGFHTRDWDGRTREGPRVVSGTYFGVLRLEAAVPGNEEIVKKMVILR
jgi:hypothetical protein